MARPRTQLTPAAGALSTELVERTYVDTISFSAEASKTWAIPDNCIRITLAGAGLAPSAVATLTAALNKKSDGLPGSFYRTGSYFTSTGQGVNNNASDTVTLTVSTTTTAPGIFSLFAQIKHPRSATIRTQFASSFASAAAAAASDTFNSTTAVALSAEDHDELVISVSSGTITGDLEITYIVNETIG